MAHDLFHVEDLDAVPNPELDRLVGHLEQILHEGQRGIPQRSLARDELAEFEQPDTKLELSGVPFQEPCIDERPDQAMDRRLGQTGFPHQIGEGQRRVVSVEDAQDPVDLAEHGTQLVPFSGSHLCIVTEAT